LALLTSCDHLIITYGSYGVMAAYFLAGTLSLFIIHHLYLLVNSMCYLGAGEVIAADKFTSNTEAFTENLHKAKWPNWHWISV
jgi:hypothetical protein